MGVSKLAIGTAQFGMNYGIANSSGQVNKSNVKSILEYARLKGINTLDTAIVYGNSESKLGKVGLKKWNVITKIPAKTHSYNSIPDWVEKCLEESLKKLGVDNLYGVLVHNSDKMLSDYNKKMIESLTIAKRKGLIKKVGMSVYDSANIINLIDYINIDLIQFPFNVFDQSFLRNGTIDYIKKQNIEIHIRSIFLQGLLILEGKDRPSFCKQFNKYFTLWDEWCKSHSMDKVEGALRVAMSLMNVDKIVVGIDNLEQLKKLVSISKSNPIKPPEELFCDEIDLINPSQWLKNDN